MDLDRYFLIGSEAGLAAQEIFTNRVSERAAFETAMANRLQEVLADPVAAVCDTRSPRRNILTYYGIGGIGKTRLSKELERETAEACRHQRCEPMTARVDFGDVATHNLESVVLTLRAALGAHAGTWPAFDLGWSVYWEKAHPGEPMRETVNRSSVWRRASDRLSLGDQMQDAVEDLLNSPGGVLGVFVSGARIVGTSVREAVLQRELLRECPFFGAVVQEEDPAKMLRYLPALLAWDLAVHQRAAEHRRLLVVFLDTWEEAQSGELRMGSFEDDMARLVHLLPNVLFVVTGRDRLRWGDHDAVHGLFWGGPEQWPGLASAADREPRQHLVGGLSREDSDRYLRDRLLRDGEPAIPQPIREAIVGGSDGLPLYLDLAATRFDQLVAAGQEPSTEQFGQSLAEVVLRVMRDLDPDQRALLRVASLLRRFDRALLRAPLPRVPDAAMDRFLQRAVVQHTDQPWAPYALHECLREAVRPSDVAADRWSEQEWDAAIDRATETLANRARSELEHASVRPLELLCHDFEEAWHLAVQRGEVPAWLFQLAARLQTRGALHALADADTMTPDDSSLSSAARGLGAIARRTQLGHARTASILKTCLKDPSLPPAAADLLTLWLGWQMEGMGDRTRADELRLGLAKGDGAFAPWARHAVGRADWVHGRLQRAVSWEFDDDDVLQRILHLGIQSNVEMILGKFSKAESLAEERLRVSEELATPETVAHALRTLAQIQCWRGKVADATWQDAVEIYTRLGNPISGAEAMVTAAVHAAVNNDHGAYAERLSAAIGLNGLTGGVDVAEIYFALLHDDMSRARQVRARLLSRNGGTRAYRFWDAITGWWLSSCSGRPERGTEVPVDWLYGKSDAQQRWTAVLEAARAGGPCGKSPTRAQ